VADLKECAMHSRGVSAIVAMAVAFRTRLKGAIREASIDFSLLSFIHALVAVFWFQQWDFSRLELDCWWRVLERQ